MQGICVEWDNPQKTVIRWDFGEWTWDDFHAAARLSMQMRATRDDRSDLPSILNFKNSGPIPSGALAHARTALEMMAARDYTVIAEASGRVRALTRIFIQFNEKARSKIFVAHTVEEARHLIHTRLNVSS